MEKISWGGDKQQQQKILLIKEHKQLKFKETTHNVWDLFGFEYKHTVKYHL